MYMMTFFTFALQLTLLILIREVNMSALWIPIFPEHTCNPITFFAFSSGPVGWLAAAGMATAGLLCMLASLASWQGLTRELQP